MENIIIARLAVSAATYAIDKPYDYIVPESLADKIVPGIRVSIPFGRGNRRSEGVVLSVQRSSDRDKLKAIEAVLDEKPIITKDQIKLALWMHERFFCTVYEAFRAMLPAGLWFKEGKRKVNDKMLQYACLALAALIVLGRLLSGVHWFTDIVGGFLLGAALVFFYIFAVRKARKKQ